MLDPRSRLDSEQLEQLVPGATLPAGATVRMAEVSAGVYRAAVHGADGAPIAEHVATDDAEAVREAVRRAWLPEPLGPAWPRDRVIGVGLGLLLGAAVVWLLRRW